MQDTNTSHCDVEWQELPGSWPAARVWAESSPWPAAGEGAWGWGACLPEAKFPRPAASVPPPEPLSVLKQID